jgi:hypothetical protein
MGGGRVTAVPREDARSVRHGWPSGGLDQAGSTDRSTTDGLDAEELDTSTSEFGAVAACPPVPLMENAGLLPSAGAGRRRATQRQALPASVQPRSADSRASQRPTGGTEMSVADLQERLRAAESCAEHLEIALKTNRRIGMAIGVLLTRHLTEQQAFDALRLESMRRNVKLRDIAEEVIYTGTL